MTEEKAKKPEKEEKGPVRVFESTDEIKTELAKLRMKDEPDTLALKEAVALMNCDLVTFWTEVKEGRFPGKKEGGRWILKIKDLVGYQCPEKVATVKATLASTQVQLEKAKSILKDLGLEDELAAIEEEAKKLEEKIKAASDQAETEAESETEEVESEEVEIEESEEAEAEEESEEESEFEEAEDEEEEEE